MPSPKTHPPYEGHDERSDHLALLLLRHPCLEELLASMWTHARLSSRLSPCLQSSHANFVLMAAVPLELATGCLQSLPARRSSLDMQRWGHFRPQPGCVVGLALFRPLGSSLYFGVTAVLFLSLNLQRRTLEFVLHMMTMRVTPKEWWLCLFRFDEAAVRG
jgi:hypothetical protein